MKIIPAARLVMFFVIPWGFMSFAVAQNESIDSDIEVLRANIRADRVEVVSKEMRLSDNEAKAFWPIYNQYETDLRQLNDRRVELLKQYADKYDKLTNSEVQSLAHRTFALQKERIDLREQYFQKFSKALSPQAAARFVQVEDRIDELLNLQISASVPLVQK